MAATSIVEVADSKKYFDDFVNKHYVILQH